MTELMQALNMFKEGVKDLQTARVIQGANDQVMQIKANETDEAKQRAALTQVSNQLVGQLGALGAPATTIQAQMQAIAPPSYASPQAAAMAGVMNNDPKLVEAAKKADEAVQSGNMAQMAQQQAFQKEIVGMQIRGAKEIAGMKAGAAAERGEKLGRLTTSQIKEIEELENSSASLRSMLTQVNENPKLVGPVAGNIPLREKFDPAFGQFKMESGQYFDAYRKAITGAGATEGELTMLKKSLPTGTETLAVYQAKVQRMLEIGDRVKKRKFDTLKRAKRDVSGFDPVSVNTTPGALNQLDADISRAGNPKSFFSPD
jgi:hypothetical protein